MVDFSIDGKWMSELGLYLEEIPFIPSANLKYDSSSPPNRDSAIMSFTSALEPVETELKLNILEDFDVIDVISKFKSLILLKLLSNKSFKLGFKNREQKYYEVIKCDIGNVNQEFLYEYGQFSVKVTLNPYFYHVKGDESVRLRAGFNEVYNIGTWISSPYFKITASTDMTMKINGIAIVFRTGTSEFQGLPPKTVNGKLIEGQIERAILMPGKNEIEVSGIGTIEIIPKWRDIA